MIHTIYTSRGDEATYRADSLGRVRSRVGKTFVANMTEGDWTAYSVVATDEAFYDITLEVLSFSKLLTIGVLFVLGLECCIVILHVAMNRSVVCTFELADSH